MSLDLYKKQVRALENEHNMKLTAIMLDYAEQNSSVEVGDFFTDHMGTIKVEKIQLHKNPDRPSLVFFGSEYTKKMTQKKSKTKRKAWEINGVKQE